MSLSELSEGEFIGKERRNSVRARTLIPCLIEKIERDQISEVESAILDMAVMDSEHAAMVTDWTSRTEELPKELVFILSEMRALRQQITEMQRIVEIGNRTSLTPRWVTINDKGLWVPRVEEDEAYAEGDLLKVQLQIPSLSSPQVLAVGEVIRVRESDSRPGMAIEFRAISAIHSRAITEYALKRERQLARSKLFSSINI